MTYEEVLNIIDRCEEAIVHTYDGDEYLIYNPYIQYGENEDMWCENYVIGLDSDGTEHEIEYKEIVGWLVLN